MTTGVYRPAIKYRIKAGIKDGKITGYHLKEAAINGNMYGLITQFFSCWKYRKLPGRRGQL